MVPACGPGMVKRESADHAICVWVLSSAVEHRIADPQVTGSIPVVPSILAGLGGGSDPRPGAMGWESARRVILVGVVGNISACHADARGSIPRRGAFLVRPGRTGPARVGRGGLISSFAHTAVSASHPVRSAKLSTAGPTQYSGGGPLGNRWW